jgi:hypothetical protein
VYRLKADEDLRFLVDTELLQVCVGRNEIVLALFDNIRITVLSRFSVAGVGDTAKEYEDPVEGAPALLALIGDTVVSARAREDGGLCLVFRSGAVVSVYDDSDEFESFTIANGTRLIVV